MKEVSDAFHIPKRNDEVTVVVLLCEIEKTAVEVEPWLSLLTTPSELRTREENEG